MRILLVRHGQAEWQTGESSSLDSRMTAQGRRQVDRLAHAFAAKEPDDVILRSSPLARASATAEAISASTGGSVVTYDDELREAPFHVASRLPSSTDPLCDYSSTAQLRDPDLAVFEKAVSIAFARALAANAGSDMPLVLVAHSVVIESVLRLITGAAAVRFEVDNTSITSLEWTQGRWRVLRLNDTAHVTPGLWST